MRARRSRGLEAVILWTALIAGPPQALAAGPVDLKVSFSHPLLAAGQKQTAFLKVALLGTGSAGPRQRAPVNVALVIDRSGSMSGEKIRQAKDAAIQAIERLSSEDIVSVVAYDDTIQVLLPATRARDKAEIARAIRRLQPGNMTALFAGVSRGAAEVRKFLSDSSVNRVILLSDGLANVGPSSPDALASLGAALRKEGISVTTIGLGLGYNEDLMYRLARASDGNHAFVESPSELATIFNYEFGDILSVVATDVEVTITCAPRVRPLRVLGRDAEIIGQTVIARLNQVYGKQEKFILLEVEVEGQPAETTLAVAEVQAGFLNPSDRNRSQLSGRSKAVFSASAASVASSQDREVMVSAVELIANDNNKRALALRDQGKVEEARKALLDNERYLNDKADYYKSKRLRKFGDANKVDADNLDGERWQKRRKAVQQRNMNYDFQQAW